MTTQNLQKLQEIFRIIFKLPRNADVTRIRRDSHEQWDSIGHIELVAALENEFQINIDIAESLRIASYETTLKMLEGKGL